MKRIFLSAAFVVSAIVMNAQQMATEHKTVVSDQSHDSHGHAPIEDKNNTVKVAMETKETEFNFGKIPQGKPVTHVFEVSNTGKTSFKLDNVQASCGCTTPVWNKEEVIAPGKTAIITVGYNAAAEGPFTKPVTITYNGTQSKVLMIKGEVWKTPSNSAPTNEGASELKN
jgi:hypothetical protein